MSFGSPMAPSDAGPQGGPLLPMGMPTAPGHATHTFSGEVTRVGHDGDARPDRPLLRRTSPLLFIVPLVLLLASVAVWWFVIRVAPVEEVVVETPAVEVPVAPELPAAVVTPEPVVPEPVVTPEPVVPVPVPPAGKKAITTKTGKTGKSGTSKSGTGKSGTSKTGTDVGKVGGASKPTAPVEPAPKPGQGGKADPGRVIMELEMLSAAKKSLAGNPGQSLAYIEQHDREFPSSQLTDKFDEVRIKALCNLGRGGQARTQAAAILKKRPGSLVGAAIKECKS